MALLTGATLNGRPLEHATARDPQCLATMMFFGKRSPGAGQIPKAEAASWRCPLGSALPSCWPSSRPYFLTWSTAIFSDALESTVNVAAAAFATYSLFLAHQPADADHPYGHGKVEFLSAGFEGGMVLLRRWSPPSRR